MIGDAVVQVDEVAVTGSTGAVGRMVAHSLAELGVPLRLLVRDRSRAPTLPGTSVRRVSYGQEELAKEALRGVKTLFMVSGAESADRLEQHRSFVDSAAAAGVQHVVYTSFVGAAPDATFTLARDHFYTEQHIRKSGMAWTFLRDSFYLDILEHFVGDDGVLRGPAGRGRCAFVARSDVARVAVEILLKPWVHADKTYDLTGREALGMTQVAETISRVRGRPVTYLDETLEQAYESRAVYGAPRWQVEAWVSTYTAIASGAMSAVSPAVKQLTGLDPLTLEQVLSSS